jgi:hypothetical protein
VNGADVAHTLADVADASGVDVAVKVGFRKVMIKEVDLQHGNGHYNTPLQSVRQEAVAEQDETVV